MSAQLHPLIAEAVQAHGGAGRWRRVNGISSTIRTGGHLWELKGQPLLPVPRRATTRFHRQWTEVTPFGEPGWTMRWTPDRVSIVDGEGGAIGERQDGREAFDRSFAGPWDPFNLAYFNGYAMWTYHALPFVLAETGYQAQDIAPVEHEGELLRGVNVRFPAAIHSHTREQVFYFGVDGLLRRHDYTVDVWADTPAAHFTSDYVDVGGLKYPKTRRVFGLKPDGALDPDFSPVTIDLSDYSLF